MTQRFFFAFGPKIAAELQGVEICYALGILHSLQDENEGSYNTYVQVFRTYARKLPVKYAEHCMLPDVLET